jgi:hypothetical protein
MKLHQTQMSKSLNNMKIETNEQKNYSFCLMVEASDHLSYTQDVYVSHGTEYVFSINDG